MRFPVTFGAVTPPLCPLEGGAFQLLNLVRLLLREFVNQLEDCLLSGDANLYEFHNGNDFSVLQKKWLSLAGRKPLQLWQN